MRFIPSSPFRSFLIHTHTLHILPVLVILTHIIPSIALIINSLLATLKKKRRQKNTKERRIIKMCTNNIQTTKQKLSRLVFYTYIYKSYIYIPCIFAFNYFTYII